MSFTQKYKNLFVVINGLPLLYCILRAAACQDKGDNMKVLPRMRTLDECYRELKQLDNNTSVTKHCIRNLALSGTIPCVMSGVKRLINFDALLNYFSKGDNQ